ncbi:unnamed protein product, partial [Pylaiella littoralis]
DSPHGLLQEAGFRTQCELTPSSGGGAVCCKPFGTPCDSSEACCTGNCDPGYTRCDDAYGDDGHVDGGNNDGQDERDNDDGQHDGESSENGGERSDDGMFNGSQSDFGQVDDGQRYGGQNVYDGGSGYGQYNVGGKTGDGRNGGGQYVAPQLDDGQDIDSMGHDTTSYGAAGDAAGGPTPASANAPHPTAAPLIHVGSGSTASDSTPFPTTDPAISDGSGSTFDSVAGRLPVIPSPSSAPHPTGAPLTHAGSGTNAPHNPPPPATTDPANSGATCVSDYFSGTIDTAASSESRLEAVAVDSQGNVFYTLSLGKGRGDTIRRAASPSSASSSGSDDDALVYSGTGIILAMAVDADDNLVFTMEDALAVSGGVYLLRMAPEGQEEAHVETTVSADDHGNNNVPEKGGPGSGSSTGSGFADELPSSTDGDRVAPAVALAAGLGPFLPGVAVCPITGDVYVTMGHTGVARLVKGTTGDLFSTKMEWSMKDMAFEQNGHTQAPLMVWDIAVNSHGIVYITTYTQGVVLKAILPQHGGVAHVRVAAGTWDSGVTASSGDGGPASSARMAYPKGVAIDGQDAVYIAEFQGEKIRQVSTNGIISTVAGSGSRAYEGDGGPASGAGLDMPNALAFVPGATGSKMAIADFGHSAVRVITPETVCP